MTSVEPRDAVHESFRIGGPLFRVRRARLIHLLDVVAEHRLTLVSAPAGYGKTSLLLDWASLDPGRVVLAASGEPVIHPAHLADISGAHTVILDEADAHEPLSGSVVGEMLDRLPPATSIVVARRQPWPERVRGMDHDAVTGSIDEHDLAFTVEEARELFEAIAPGSDILLGEVEGVVERTDGWAAGLVLAGLARRDVADADGDFDPVEAVRPHVDDFVEDEVLAPLSREDVDFLVRTSLVDRLSADVCDAVTARSGSDVRLRRLRRAGVISRTRDTLTTTYTRHPMLRQVLRRRLFTEHSREITTLVERASAWFLERNEVELALDQHAAVRDWEAVLGLLNRHGLALFERGLTRDTIRRLGAVPAFERFDELQPVLEYAALQTFAGESRGAERSLEHADALATTPGERLVIACVRASWVRHHLPARDALAVAEDALAIAEPVDTPDVFGLTAYEDVVRLTRGSLAQARWHLGDVEGARAVYEKSVGPLPEYAPWAVRAVGSLALIEAWAGRLRLAELYGRYALAAAAGAGLRAHRTTSEARLALAHVELERNRLHTASVHLLAGRALAARHRESTNGLIGAIEQARLDHAEDRAQLGLERLSEWLRGRDVAPMSRFHALARSTEAMLWAALGERARARAILDAETEPLDDDASAVAARIALEERDLDRAAEVLEAWPDRAERRSRLERELLMAAGDHLRGRRSAALARVEGIVPEAEAEGLVRLFLDNRSVVRGLVRDAAKTMDSALLVSASLSGEVRGTSEPGAVGELSDRELEVLRYLPSRLSTADIARHLYISRNTLKTHLRSIYRKLGVSSRDAAAARAEELGLA